MRFLFFRVVVWEAGKWRLENDYFPKVFLFWHLASNLNIIIHFCLVRIGKMKRGVQLAAATSFVIVAYCRILGQRP